ncbi:MAG: amidase [Desertifilum sp.]|nr:amidase [Desertifilum sp.]
MDKLDLAFASAIDQAKLIRDRTVSPLELVELYLERIQRLDPQLGSYFTVMADQALAEAKAKTEKLGRNAQDLPPFFGVPISIKDLNPVAGVPCSYGIRALMAQPAEWEPALVGLIRAAGFTILGKTATSELGSMPFTEPTGFPPTRNPWNLEYTAGGSSGGAAAGVAAGLCAIAQGSDGGGSVRGPASCCGVVGLKPSRGRISNAPVGDRISGIATDGSIARTVADAAALLDVMSGYITGDPYWLPPPEISFLEATKSPPKPLRIAFATNLPLVGEAAPSCKQAVLETAQILTDMGHTLEEGCPEFADLVEPFTVVWQTAIAAAGVPVELLQPINQWFFSRVVDAGSYLRAVSQMQIVSRRIVSFFDNYDALLIPVYMHSPIRVGEWAQLSPPEVLQKVIDWIAPCPPFNATGQPAIALPVGLDERGLPTAVQLVGKPAAESTILALAAELERAKPGLQRPPLSVK